MFTATLCCLDNRLQKQIRETITVIRTRDNYDLKQSSSSGVAEKYFSSGNILNKELAGQIETWSKGG